MIKAIIFDFDGVLFDSQALHFESCNQALEPLGLSVSHEFYLEKFVGMTDSALFRAVLSAAGRRFNEADIRALLHEKIRLYRHAVQEHASLKGVEGIRSFLATVSQFLDTFGVCSNGNASELYAVLNKLEGGNLKSYFKKITTREDVSQGKPSPEGYLKTAADLNVLPENCLVIEDSHPGIRAGKSAKMQVVGLATSYEPCSLTAADFVARNYAEVQAWLLPQLTHKSQQRF